MNGILIANTTASTLRDYYIPLVMVFVFVLFFTVGFRLADIRIKERRKRKESDS